jgi:hypothetical protein
MRTIENHSDLAACVRCVDVNVPNDLFDVRSLFWLRKIHALTIGGYNR